MAKTYRVAIIGSTGRGDYGHGLDTVWKEIPETRVVAVADDNDEGRAKASERLGSVTTYADFRQMLDREKPDLVAIGPRWVDQHLEMILACIEHRAHIFMEKPFCRTLEEADQIVRACEMTHTKLAIAHQTRYCPIIPVVRKLIEEGKLGTLLEFRARGKEDARGGGEDLWVLGSHVLNMMTVFGGMPVSCYGTVTQKGRPVSRMDVVEGNEGLGPLAGDAVSGQYQFAGGINGFFASRRGEGGSPSRFGIQILGSKGIVEYLSGYLPAVHFLADPSWSPGRSGGKWQRVTSAGVDQPEPLPGGNAVGNIVAVRDLIDAIEKDRQPLCGPYDGRMTIEMILGIFESHRQKQPVELPLVNRRHPLTMLG
jgi:predicted dehydrogenase